MIGFDVVDDHLRGHYAIEGDIAIERVAMGRASNHKVSSEGRSWLFKVFQAEYTPIRLLRAADFVRYLASSGYPVREFVSSRAGAPTTVLEGRAAVLIPWVEGDTPESNTLSSPDALNQIGALCGRLHRLGSTYPGAEALDAAGRVAPREVAAKRIVDKRSALFDLAAQTQDAEIQGEIGTRIAILDRLGDDLATSDQQVRHGVIHGDFFCSHVVFREQQAIAMIDVLGERYAPAWEMMRGFFQSVPSVFQSPEFEVPWRAYLSGYASEHPIQPRDIALAYDTYLLQLSSSRYGLQPPLDDKLRAFGRWRTRMAQYLADQRAEVRLMMTTAPT
jgi:Ser/Thr protein kinase RdoA (MazF antagonist)